MKDVIKIATRKSALALWQANYVAAQLKNLYPDLIIELVPMSTQGDIILDKPLSKVGGKGLFLKELENALLDNRADIAVHSLKDVTAQMPKGLILPVVLERGNPLDAFVSMDYSNLEALPKGAKIGTSSLRRVAQLKHTRADLNIVSLRGNVNSRLEKLVNKEFDAIILACAGLERLGFEAQIRSMFSVEDMLPAVGQGVVAIQCREGDNKILQYIKALHCPVTAPCVDAEREMNAGLGGGCSVPVAGFAHWLDSGNIELNGRVMSIDGQTVYKAMAQGHHTDAKLLGQKVANHLIAQGALEIINSINQEKPHA